MSRVLVPLAEGCEEMEAVTIIDLLRRGGIEVVAAGLSDGPVTGSRGTRILPDTTLDEALETDFDMVVLPGGLPGSDHLAADDRVTGLLRRMNESGRFVGAVCAAPKVLARAGILDGKRATAFPGVLQAEAHPDIGGEPVVRDGTVITSRSAGTAMDFGLALVEALAGRETRKEVEAGLARDQD
ncbi:MAG: DJ-1/PfpI family protein [Gammaproteobacteria bacterium]|jgi:4-methyl-5(b-hydroxyethyl)-thiazole monophosphate biosynthesis|nr:DJ-1/PfpI family protein [Gammaproteobacteria bacterium]